MKVVLTPAEMAEADRHAIASGTPEAVLVERAGSAVARHAQRMLGGAYGRRVSVVTGKGNNGADGRVAARRLRERGIGVDELSLERGFADGELRRAVGRADLVIDAMYGTGFRGQLEGAAAAVAEWSSASDVPVLAVDIPSGVNGATGACGPGRARERDDLLRGLQARTAVRTGPNARGPGHDRRHRHRGRPRRRASWCST